MRVTTSYLTRNYLNNANKVLKAYNASNERLTSGRAFTRVSQNISGGKKALTIRTQIYQNAQYQKNVETVSEELDVVESSLMAIQEVLQTAGETAIRANGVQNADSKATLAAALGGLKETVIQTANSSYVNKNVLGGTNTGDLPFAVDDNGRLLFNGSRVDSITQQDDLFYDQNGEVVEMSSDVYVDIGLGIRMNGDVIDDRSVYKVSFSGLEALGYGSTDLTYTDKEGNEQTVTASNNVYDLLTQMQDAILEDDMAKLGKLNDHLTDGLDNVLSTISEIGIKQSYLETKLAILQDEEVSLATQQSELEGVDDTEEIIKYNEYKYSWMLTLQFGSNVLPQSLMDFIQ